MLSTRIQRLASKTVTSRHLWSIPNNISSFLTPNFEPEPIHLFTDTKASGIAAKVNVYSDQEYGGQSVCDYSKLSESNGVPITRFNGSLQFKAEEKILNDEVLERERAKKGYCSIKVRYDKAIDLRDYEGVEVILRSKKNQRVLLNMQCFSYARGDMYQAIVDIQGYEERGTSTSPGSRIARAFTPDQEGWVRLLAPFSVFRLTIRGQPTEQQRLNDSLQLEAMGLLVSGEGEERFEIDVLEMKAIKEIPLNSRNVLKYRDL